MFTTRRWEHATGVAWTVLTLAILTDAEALLIQPGPRHMAPECVATAPSPTATVVGVKFMCFTDGAGNDPDKAPLAGPFAPPPNSISSSG